jgi:6-phosphogluconolactonase (cycloisomerase 2 family)
MVWAFWATVSADGRNVYVSGGIGNAIAVFRRDGATGALTQPPDPSGCVRNRTGGTGDGGPPASASGCTLVDNLSYPRSIALSPDGAFLYAAAFKGDSIVAFKRDGATGLLSPVKDGCISSRKGQSCEQTVANLDGATDIALSKDGRFVYVTAFKGNAVTVMTRDPYTGKLAALPGGCLSKTATGACTAARGLNGAYNIALSPDERNAYVASRYSAAIAVFRRDKQTGALEQLPGRAGCISLKEAGCRRGRGLKGARGVAVSPDGRNVYAGSFSGSAITAFSRDGTTGALTELPGRHGCITNTTFERARPKRGCTRARGLRQAWGIAVSGDGRFVYSGTGGDNNTGMAIFRRARR